MNINLTKGVIAAVLLVTGSHAAASAQTVYEAQPVLRVSELAPASLLSGPRFKVDERVPTTEFLARFTIRSDFGVVEAHGREMLATRVAEVGALEQLANVGKSEEFLKAAGKAAARPVEAAANIVVNPAETVQGLPGAAGRLWDRVEFGTRRMKEAASEPGKSTEDKAAEVTKRVGSVSVDVLGYDEERRTLAKRLGVDPYTTNPLLAEKLTDVAWVAFSGRLAAVAIPFGMALTAASVTNELVWDMAPADLIKLNEKKLLDMGASDQQAQALLRNPWYSLTVLTSLVTGLESLGRLPGRDQVVAFAATATSEDQARLINGAVQMLARYHATVEPLAQLAAPGPVIGRDRDGSLVVAAPLDYVAWTERMSLFARRSELQAKRRLAWITGDFSPRAKQELEAAGWTLRAGVESGAQR